MADVIAGTPGCETAFLPAERMKDGRWSIGFVAGPGGFFPMILPEGSDPAALTATQIQAAHDEAARGARTLSPCEGEAVPAAGLDLAEALAGLAPREPRVDVSGFPVTVVTGTPLAIINPWRPIEDAPLREAVLVAWEGSDYEPHIACQWSVDGVWADYREGYELDPPPTHWMPLPAAPKGAQP